jgi:signal transduction histidine kinase
MTVRNAFQPASAAPHVDVDVDVAVPLRSDSFVPPVDGGTALLWRALTRAANAACKEWQDRGGPTDRPADLPPPDVRADVAAIVDAVDSELAERAPDAAVLRVGPDGLRLLGTVRWHFIAEAQRIHRRVQADQVLRVLRALERVQQAMTTVPRRPPAESDASLQIPDWMTQVAHDIRAPLTSILFLTDTMRTGQSGRINTVQERQLGLMFGAAFSLCSIANDVIDMGRGSGALLGSPVSFSASEMLHSVRSIVLPIVEEKGLALEVIPPDIDFRVGHPLALSRVFLNLTENALKFTEQGSVRVVVRNLDGRRVECSVTDTGPGIPDSVITDLFRPLRSHCGHGGRMFSTSGLGLAICRRLVTAMEGELRVETRQGAGTRFYFDLDLPPAPEG